MKSLKYAAKVHLASFVKSKVEKMTKRPFLAHYWPILMVVEISRLRGSLKVEPGAGDCSHVSENTQSGLISFQK